MPAPKQKAAEAKKVEADRLQGFLQEMLREEENKYCADCESKQPRWASWNLGVFLCIRCAGLHRNLGVHISKVKSVTLDSWTPEQIQSMRVMGNAKARAVYESELPSVFRRPQTDQSLEQFIRAKYESKRYLMKGWIPPRIDINDLPAFPETVTRDKKAAALLNNNHSKCSAIITESSNSKIQQSSPPTLEKAIIPELINFDSMPAHTHHDDSSNPNANQKTDASIIDDLFGPIVTATPPVQHQPIPTSLSMQNINNFHSLNNNDTQKQMNQTTAMLNQTQSGICEHFDSSNFTSITNTGNPLQSIDSDLLGLDLSMCSINNQSGTQIRKSQSSSTMLDLPPASDIKKSTNEILALFKK